MLLRWVNHASFVVEDERSGVKLICDPWLAGPAFDRGWDLLAESVFETRDFAEITHIWYSHEHPDHFVPRVLQDIDEARRPQITVLYQKTRDGKVAKFCKSLGYAVRELGDGERVELGREFHVTCGVVPFYDSWLLIEAGGKRVLNLNDCVVDRDAVAARIAKEIGGGPVDVLLSQFNDAEWKGNPDQRALREASASEKLRRLQLQTKLLKPAHTIPFASFFYFSHDENFYLNDAMNRVGDVARFLDEDCGTRAVVLYPGDTWEPGAPHDNAAACKRYDDDVANARPIQHAGESKSIDDLVRIATSYRNRIKKQNNAFLLNIAGRLLPKLRVYLEDHDTVVQFDWRDGLTRVSVPKQDADIAMHSESLAFVLRFDWGMDTLTVNGRLRASQAGYQRFVKTFAPGSLNNIGRRLGFELIADPPFLRRMLSM